MAKELQGEIRALDLGRKIRELRLRRGLTLKIMSERTGLSKPLLSQIENHVAAPPIATLLKISHALGVSIAHFFQEAAGPNRIAVVRQRDRRQSMLRIHEEASMVGYRYESLAYPRDDKHMEPFIVEIEPREEKDLLFYNHRGEEFLFVLEGRLEFRGADHIIALDPGDSLYFDGDISHALRGLEGERAVVLAVIYTPE